MEVAAIITLSILIGLLFVMVILLTFRVKSLEEKEWMSIYFMENPSRFILEQALKSCIESEMYEEAKKIKDIIDRL